MSYKGAALKISCPHCNEYESHEVHKTDPNRYHWGKEDIALFERLVGRDLHYRKRERKCSNCTKIFSTVEMSFDYLRALVNEVKALESKNEELKQKVSETGKSLIELSKET